MTSISDGLSNIEAINAQITALQQNGGTGSAASSTLSSPDAFILQTQQNFNAMLTNLMSNSTSDTGDNTGDNSSDPFASLMNNQNLQTQLTTAGNTGLTELNQTSALLGRQAAYLGPTGAEVTGIISQISLDASGNPIVIMADGHQVPVSSITRVSQ